MDNGQEIFLWIGASVAEHVLIDLFNVSTLEQVPVQLVSIQL